MSRRKKPSISQRATPCQVCGFPLSECHHLAPVAFFGAGTKTVQLCANCHDLFHLARSAGPGESRRALRLFCEVIKQAVDTPLMANVVSVIALMKEAYGYELELSQQVVREFEISTARPT